MKTKTAKTAKTCRAFGMFIKDDEMCQNCEPGLREECIKATRTKKIDYS